MNTFQVPTFEEVNTVNLQKLLPYVDARDTTEFLKPAGKTHYKLLAFLSTQFNNAELFDIGSWHGSSAVALSYNPNNVVYSFNVQNERQCEKNPFNVSYRIQDLLELKQFAKTDFSDMSVEDKQRYFPDFEMYTKLQYSPLVVIDVHNAQGIHDGVLEQQFYDLLKLVGFSGMAVFDDVQLNAEMRAFWDKVKEEKNDVTTIGHGDYGAGTGIVDFKNREIKLPKFKVLQNGRPVDWVD